MYITGGGGQRILRRDLKIYELEKGACQVFFLEHEGGMLIFLWRYHIYVRKC